MGPPNPKDSMKPKTSLIVSLGILVVTFIGARVYVGRMLHQDPTAPKVHYIDANAPRPKAAPAEAPPKAEPDVLTADQMAIAKLESAILAFTAIDETVPTEVEVDAALALGQPEVGASAIADWKALTEEDLQAVPEKARSELMRSMALVTGQIPDASTKRAFLEGRLRILKSWGQSLTETEAALAAL